VQLGTISSSETPSGGSPSGGVSRERARSARALANRHPQARFAGYVSVRRGLLRNRAQAERPRRDWLSNDRAAAERLRLKIGPEGVVGATGFLRWATVGRRGGRARRQADAIVDSSSFGGDPIFIARRAACRYEDGVRAWARLTPLLQIGAPEIIKSLTMYAPPEVGGPL
jgi:hypothetical protein